MAASLLAAVIVKETPRQAPARAQTPDVCVCVCVDASMPSGAEARAHAAGAGSGAGVLAAAVIKETRQAPPRASGPDTRCSWTLACHRAWGPARRRHRLSTRLAACLGGQHVRYAKGGSSGGSLYKRIGEVGPMSEGRVEQNTWQVSALQSSDLGMGWCDWRCLMRRSSYSRS